MARGPHRALGSGLILLRGHGGKPRFAALAGLATLGLVTACPSFGSSDGDGEAKGDASDASVTGDATAPAEAGADGAVAAASGCPAGRGPVMVRNQGFCIDSTEVTNEQFARFLEAKPSGDVGPAVCSWKGSYVPANWPYPPDRASVPVTFVDWCDADAFCRWSGKRLCGEIGSGGPLVGPNRGVEVASSEWYATCTAGGTRTLPYGTAYEADACNLKSGAPAPAAKYTKCEGGLPGVFDMLGNVFEWANWCDGANGADDTCRDFSSFFAGKEDHTCATVYSGARKTRNANTGFRCCADARP